MNFFFTRLTVAVVLLISTSCASIVSKSSYPIHIKSNPTEARIIITDRDGIEVYDGLTPASLTLDASAGFFRKAQYTISFEKEGYAPTTIPVVFKLDGWYFGNLLFGGLVGLLIVDPATGAMYKLSTEYVSETLTPLQANTKPEELKIYTIDQIPADLKGSLVKITN